MCVCVCWVVIQKNMVTASYASTEMQALDEEAKAARVTIMNECGLDPGLDHMFAMKVIDQVQYLFN